ncbi:hypothetical protein FISHEDRAFT_78774 [Fistulina hepatica ATCC 64428]|uniref:Uncharacterized protein n=1 Tax=Fistulina hepatica ATCC 64428 TaxID=1128425 RepID=A0A0D6ZZ66_9AGAR|nr:hypothetical protein FISHEDRAFT_78774 [Fistulina hepatica ATCC 64428]
MDSDSADGTSSEYDYGKYLDSRSPTTSYYQTKDSFVKRELPYALCHTDARTLEPIPLLTLGKLFTHEVNVHRHLTTYTDIPLLPLIDSGVNNDGLAFIKTKMMTDTLFLPCQHCEEIIWRKADDFVHCKVYSELQKLRSRQTGLKGFVVLPGWIQKAEKQGYWEPKQSEMDEFFVIHELVLENMFFSTLTLDVAALTDIQQSGYFP